MMGNHVGYFLCGARFRFAVSLPGREGCASHCPAVLSSKNLRFSSLAGCRPMKEKEKKLAYVRAQRQFFLFFFRTAHSLARKVFFHDSPGGIDTEMIFDIFLCLFCQGKEFLLILIQFYDCISEVVWFVFDD